MAAPVREVCNKPTWCQISVQDVMHAQLNAWNSADQTVNVFSCDSVHFGGAIQVQHGTSAPHLDQKLHVTGKKDRGGGLLKLKSLLRVVAPTQLFPCGEQKAVECPHTGQWSALMLELMVNQWGAVDCETLLPFRPLCDTPDCASSRLQRCHSCIIRSRMLRSV